MEKVESESKWKVSYEKVMMKEGIEMMNRNYNNKREGERRRGEVMNWGGGGL